MIYNEFVKEYKVKFYQNRKGESQTLEYIENLDIKEKAKVLKYIDFLRENNGYLDEPYSKHIKGAVRELRVDFRHNKHRIFYFTFIGKTIILLYAFLKKTAKTPLLAIKKAEENYQDVLRNKKFYE